MVRKKIVSVDTSIAVPGRGKSSAARIFQRSVTPTYNQITNNTFSIQERLSRYQDYCEMEMCLSYHTLIASPEYEDGFVEIGKLAEECEKNPDKTFIVYAYNHEKGHIVPTLGKQARKTTTDKSWKVTFDDGQEIIGSFEHRLMLRDGTYCKLGELKTGMAMMPFYRRDLYARKEEAETTGYRWVYTMSDRGYNGWQSEHNLVAEFVAGREVAETEVVHHINFKKSDNTPSNLLIMDDAEHRAYHARIVNGKKWAPENQEWIDKFKKNHSEFMKNHNPVKRHDITFGRILETCERVGFNINKLQEALDAHLSVIGNRLEEKGFKNFSTFAKAYSPGWRNGGWDNQAESNPKFDKSITFETVCAAYEKGMNLKQLAAKMGYSRCKVEKRIQLRGYKNYKEFTATYENMKVVSVEYYGEIDLYDLTVDGYKNFATSTVISHNTPELNACLNLYADETCSSDEKGRVLHIYSTNSKIRSVLEDLFYNNLNIEFNLRPWVRNLCKYGDAFLLNDVDPELGVVNAVPIPVNHIERVENYDPNDPFAIKFRWVDKNKELDNWEVTHMRLLGNDMFLPYGSSVVEGARRIWRQLILIEDAMLTYRITRSPERRVFYIDIGAIPPDEVGHYMEQVKTTLRGALVSDQASGRTDQRYSPLSIEEDYFLPVRGTESGTRIDTLKGGENVGTVNDVEYIQKKLFAALQVPKAYLGFEEALGSKASLAQIDVRFSRTISMIQRTIISELNKLAMVHLAVAGYSDQDLVNFSLRLSNPSSVAQQQKLELIRSKFEIMGTSPEGLLSRDWLRLNVMGMTPEEIVQVEKEILDDAQGAAAREAASLGGGGETDEGMDLGGEDLSGGTPDMGGAPSGSPSLAGSEVVTAGEYRGNDLVLAHDDPSDTTDAPIRLSMKDDDSPVKVQTHLDRLLYNKKRRRHDGSTTHGMPDLSRMTGNDTPEMKDPTDSSFMKSFSKLGAVSETKEYALHIDPFLNGDDPGLSQDLRHALERMKAKLESKKVTNATVLSENAEEIDLDDFDDTDIVEKA